MLKWRRVVVKEERIAMRRVSSVFVCSLALVLGAGACVAAEALALRSVVSLNGTWQIGEGSLEAKDER
jgi:hypothetical protein